MRVALLVDCYLPEPGSAARLIHDLAVEIERQGHETLVIAPDPTLTESHRIDVEGKRAILRVRSPKIKRTGRIWRALQEWYLPYRIARQGKQVFAELPCDLLVFYSPTIFFSPLVRRLKAQWSCRAYLILRDIFPQWAVDAGILRDHGVAHRVLQRVERAQYEVSDVVGVQSHRNLEYFMGRDRLASFSLEVLYNWKPPSPQDRPASDERYRLGFGDDVVFVYGGNMGVAQQMDDLVQLADSLRDEPHVLFFFLGDGEALPRIRREVERRGLDNVRFLPPVDPEAYPRFIEACDVGLVSLDRRHKTQNFPVKTLAYLDAGIPVLASINPGNDLRTVLEQSGAGLVCDSGCDGELREAALRLVRDSELRRRMGDNGRKLLAEQFSVERAAKQILASAA